MSVRSWQRAIVSSGPYRSKRGVCDKHIQLHTMAVVSRYTLPSSGCLLLWYGSYVFILLFFVVRLPIVSARCVCATCRWCHSVSYGPTTGQKTSSGVNLASSTRVLMSICFPNCGYSNLVSTPARHSRHGTLPGRVQSLFASPSVLSPQPHLQLCLHPSPRSCLRLLRSSPTSRCAFLPDISVLIIAID